MVPTYLSLAAFYASEPLREQSAERDVGLTWRAPGHRAPTFRAAWVKDTGELYLVQHEGVLGGGRVEVAGRFETQAAMDAATAGWQAAATQPGSLRWLVERLPDASASLRRIAGLAGGRTPRRPSPPVSTSAA